MTLKEFSLEGKAAVVIGAEHAVGRAAATALAEAGAKVLIASQEPGTEKQLKDTAKRSGHRARRYRFGSRAPRFAAT